MRRYLSLLLGFCVGPSDAHWFDQTPGQGWHHHRDENKQTFEGRDPGSHGLAGVGSLYTDCRGLQPHSVIKIPQLMQIQPQAAVAFQRLAAGQAFGQQRFGQGAAHG